MIAGKLIRRLVLGLMLSLTAGQALAYCFSCEQGAEPAQTSTHAQHAGHTMATDADTSDNCCDGEQCGAGNCFVYVPPQFGAEINHSSVAVSPMAQYLRAPPVSSHFKPPIYS